MTKRVTLRELAHARSGEKGRDSNITVVAYDERDYGILLQQVTVDAVRSLYGPITRGGIVRYEVPTIGALNFVIEDVLEGGRSRTLAFEESGKALSSLMLTMEIDVPADYVGRSQRAQAVTLSPPTPAGQGRRIRIGSAAAWSRDRFEPAEDLIRRGNVDYLCFDAMSEVTMSMAQMEISQNPGMVAYDPMLEARLAPILAIAKERGVKIITSAGWLDPLGAADRILDIARGQGLSDLKVAAVSGSVVTDRIADLGLSFTETGQPIAASRDAIVSAEAYLGAEGIVEALGRGADVVICTRVADAALYLGPLAFEFGWSFDDPELMARGMVIGHILECGSQVCGGYFADPGYRDVPRLEDLGSPIGEISEDRILITKLPDSGGIVSSATCKEQLLYEVQDPRRYYCPDVVVDLTRVRFRDVGEDEVEVLIDGAGAPKTDTYKALVGLREGHATEELVLFAGPGALARAEMTKALLLRRFERVALKADELRFDYVGLNSIHREASPAPAAEPYEVILRIALRTKERGEAEKLRREVDPLAVNGVYGTGKWATSAPGSRVRPVIGLNSVLVPKADVPVSVTMLQ